MDGAGPSIANFDKMLIGPETVLSKLLIYKWQKLRFFSL